MRIIPERASHWYHQNGMPCFKVPKKSGDGMKDATVREAREMNLLPSVTSILKVISKPELEAWKIEQGILSALTLPRQRESFESWRLRVEAALSMSVPENAQSEREQLLRWAYVNPPRPIEDEHEFAQRVVNDSQEQASDAADFGRRIHRGVEAFLLNNPYVEDPEIEPYLQQVRAWTNSAVEDVHQAEKIVVSPRWGFAGTLDLHCNLTGVGDAVLDFKTQNVRNGKPTFYDEWYLQLSAYAAAIAYDREPDNHTPSFPAIVSVVIDSNKPAPVIVHQWPDPMRGFVLFLAAFELWKHQKKYDPTLCPKQP